VTIARSFIPRAIADTSRHFQTDKINVEPCDVALGLLLNGWAIAGFL
jgi:hypothetical protein